MNQILFTQTPNRSEVKKIGIEKIVMFFCIFIIFFGLILSISGGINIYKKISNASKTGSNQGETLPQTEIKQEDNEDDEDDEDDDEDEIDETKPKIEEPIYANNFLSIKITDETELDYITYKWNDEEEKKIYPSQNDSKTIEDKIEVPKGINNLTILAVDKAGNQKQYLNTYEGVVNAQVDYKIDLNDNCIVIKVKDEYGIDHIDYKLNEKKYRLVVASKQKEIEYRQPLEEGVNIIDLTVYSINGYEFKRMTARYSPEGNNNT